MAKGAASSFLAGGFILFWLLFWSAITGTFDVIIFRSIAEQLAARSWPTVAGVITDSTIEQGTDSDGDTTYKLAVKYRYSVMNRTYTGERFRAGQMSASSRRQAEQSTKLYPPNAQVQVRYDPADPSRAVLEAGVQGIDLFLLTFMTPFNVVAVGGWAMLVVGLWRRGRPWSPLRLEGLDEIRLRMPAFPPWGVFLIAMGGIAFAMIFIVGFTTAMDPPLGLMGAAWSIILGGALVAAVLQWRKARSGAYDFVVNHREGTLSFPMRWSQDVPGALMLERVTAVGTYVQASNDSDTSDEHGLEMRHLNAEGAEVVVRYRMGTREEQAATMAAALRAELALG